MPVPYAKRLDYFAARNAARKAARTEARAARGFDRLDAIDRRQSGRRVTANELHLADLAREAGFDGGFKDVRLVTDEHPRPVTRALLQRSYTGSFAAMCAES